MDSSSTFDQREIGPYKVIDRLSQGGQGAIFRCAVTGQNNTEVAVKVLHDSASSTRFEREILLSRLVVHRNVVQVLDFGRDEDVFYYAMELYPQNLVALTSEVSLDSSSHASVALDLLDGLEAIHSYCIVHRDLKPRNILVDASGNAVISDLGIASAGSRSNGLTIEGGIGTATYMAPEQAAGL